MLDGNARQDLAAFCQTWEEPEIHKLMDECIDKNSVDKDEYLQIAEIEVTGLVQVCWHKFTRYRDVRHREIPMDKGRWLMTLEEVLKRCDENTIGVVPTLGVSFTGGFESVESVSKALDQLQKDIGRDIRIHVDVASGGFLDPFCAPDLV